MATVGETVVFVEVKTKTNGDFGDPVEEVTPQKQQQLVSMGEEYALNVFVCRIVGDEEPELLEDHDEMAWVSISDPESVAWLPVDLPPLYAAIEWIRSHL